MSNSTTDEWCPRIDCENLEYFDLGPYSNISGYGVVIGFFGTAYFVLLLVIAHYIFAFDPDEDPFFAHKSHNKVQWQPNPIDDRLLKSFRKIWRLSPNGSRRFRAAFNESIITMCDIQIVTGLGILISGYILLPCGIDAYHWQMTVNLAWFSAVTHLSGLTALRTHLNTYMWAKYVRFTLMLSLLILLVIGLLPTAFIFQDDYGFSTPAVCLFRSLDRGFHDLIKDKERVMKRNNQWQAMLLSVFLLIFGFVTRSVKLFRPLSDTLRGKIRQPIGDWPKKWLRELARPRSSDYKYEALRIKLIFNPALSVFTMICLGVDLYSSMLFEVYWLLIILLWGNVKFLVTRNEAIVQDETLLEENTWTFGQILPVLLLFGPVFTTMCIFIFHFTAKKSLSATEHIGEEDEVSVAETVPLQNLTQDLERGHCSIGEEHVLTQISIPRHGEQPGSGPNDGVPDPDVQDFNYKDAVWFPACIGSLLFNVLGVTLIAFSTTFYFGRQDDDASEEYYSLSLYELWIGKLGLVYLVLVSYPCACVTTIGLGIGMEKWLKTFGARRPFPEICFLVYFLDLLFIGIAYADVDITGEETLKEMDESSNLRKYWFYYFWGLEMLVFMYVSHALVLVGKELVGWTLLCKRIAIRLRG